MSETSSFLIVVVIYESALQDSLTIESLLKIKSTFEQLPEVLVYDNSKQPQLNAQALPEIVNYYKHDETNSGVSGAFNYAMQSGLKLRKQWLVLFDQDSGVAENYFQELYAAVGSYPDFNLFCPTVISAGHVVSPTRIVFHKPLISSKPKTGVLKTRFRTVINSGLTIKLQELIALGGYDSDLPLDFSDHYFFYKFKKRNKYLISFNCFISHNLSTFSDVTFDAVYVRFKKYCQSAFIYSRKTRGYAALIWAAIRALKLSVKFSRGDFLKFFISRTTR